MGENSPNLVTLPFYQASVLRMCKVCLRVKDLKRGRPKYLVLNQIHLGYFSPHGETARYLATRIQKQKKLRLIKRALSDVASAVYSLKRWISDLCDVTDTCEAASRDALCRLHANRRLSARFQSALPARERQRWRWKRADLLRRIV
jgi:hypothetical protein